MVFEYYKTHLPASKINFVILNLSLNGHVADGEVFAMNSLELNY